MKWWGNSGDLHIWPQLWINLREVDNSLLALFIVVYLSPKKPILEKIRNTKQKLSTPKIFAAFHTFNLGSTNLY